VPFDQVLLEITDFVKGLTKDQILSTLAPLPKVYLSSDTYEIFVYDNTIHDWVNYGGKFKVFDLTQEEYDELSPEEKADPNKLYLIDDDTIYLTTEDIQYGTSANWRSKPTLVSRSNTIYVYTDGYTKDAKNIARFKVGDGHTLLIEVPYTDMVFYDHVNDPIIHITQEEREFWNNKVSCNINGENIVFTTGRF
jgi:hypothetical protein